MTEPSEILISKPQESLESKPAIINPDIDEQMRDFEGIISQFEQFGISDKGEKQIHNEINAGALLLADKKAEYSELAEVRGDQEKKQMQFCEDPNRESEASDPVESSQEEHKEDAMKVETQSALAELKMSQNDADHNQMENEERKSLEKDQDENELGKQMPQEEDEKEMDTQQNIKEKTENHSQQALVQQRLSNMTKEELELREFLLKDENNKEMPCCGDIIEKDGGCNRIECSCGKQVCWVCLEYFDEKDDCYSHLIDVHGGYFEENEIENMIKSGAKKLLCCGNLAFNEGDNHVVCPICRKHSCWLCLEVFTNGGDYNKHSYKAHKDNE